MKLTERIRLAVGVLTGKCTFAIFEDFCYLSTNAETDTEKVIMAKSLLRSAAKQSKYYMKIEVTSPDGDEFLNTEWNYNG